MWGQGRRDRPEEPELSASSIGITIAALNLCDGLNVFGEGCSHETVLFVDPDAVFRNVTILHSLLPRESRSIDVDSALIMTKGFPAFVVEDPGLCEVIERNVESELLGSRGYKRFIGDFCRKSGPEESLNDNSVPVTETSELEWPFIVLFQIMTCIFEGRVQDISKYRDILDPILYKTEGYPTLPLNCCHNEDESQDGLNKNPSTVFQAFLILTELLEKQLILPHEIDYRRRKIQNTCNVGHPIIQIALLSESLAFQALLSTYGITSQTPNQIESVYVWPSSKLVDLLYYHGSDEVLGLTGRPKRPLGSLCTSRIWNIGGKTVICIPLFQDKQDFYISKDETFVAKAIKSHLKFLKKHWRESARPTFCLLLTSTLFKKNSRLLFTLLNSFKTGSFKNVPIKTGRLQELITAACKMEIVNVAPHMDFHASRILASPVLRRKTLSIKSLTGSDLGYTEAKYNSDEETEGVRKYSRKYSEILAECQTMDRDSLSTQAVTNPVTASNIIALIELSARFGRDYRIDRETVIETMEHHYKNLEGDWLALRCAGGFLGKTVDSLAPSVSAVIVSGRSLSLGVHGEPEILVEGPLHPRLLHDILHNQVGKQSLLHATLQQECLICVADLLVDHPELFKGILIIRVGSLIHLLQTVLTPEEAPLETLPPVETLSPHRLGKKIRYLLTYSNSISRNGPWQEHRLINGTLGRVPDNFSARVWLILQHQNIRFTCGHCYLVSGDILGTKVSEPFFAMKIERFLNCFEAHSRNFVIELFHVLASTLVRNPEVNLVEDFHVLDFIEKSEVEIDESLEVVSKKFISFLIKFEFVKLANIENCIVS